MSHRIVRAVVPTLTLAVAVLASTSWVLAADQPAAAKPAATTTTAEKQHAIGVVPSDAELKKRLTALQYKVVRENGTERPFQSEFWRHKEEGIYVDIVSGTPLFSSKDKFDTDCGWPGFAKPIDDGEIKELMDKSHGMERIEVRSKTADSHLGHVFNDGPKELGGLRYCINSAALRFVPKAKMQEAGYGAWLKIFDAPAKGAETTAAKK